MICCTPPEPEVTLSDGKVNVSTGVAHPGSPVHSLMVFVATGVTASENVNVMFRDGSKVLMPFGGSEALGLNTGATTSGLARNAHVALPVIAAVVLPAKSVNAPASVST